MAIENPSDAAGAREAAAETTRTKKSAVKKTATKKSAGKRSAKKAAKKIGAKRAATGAAAERQRAKLDEERRQYRSKIEANEARLRAGQTSNGKPLTPEQSRTLDDILARQRQHFAELEAYEQARLDEDPRL